MTEKSTFCEICGGTVVTGKCKYVGIIMICERCLDNFNCVPWVYVQEVKEKDES